MRQSRDLPSGPPRPRIPLLWAKYLALKAALEDIAGISKSPGASDLERLKFESEKAEPMMLTLDEIALEIADAPASSMEDVQIKAKVLLEYLDPTDPDAVQRLAMSLCTAVLGST
jgi:hypothetical protein